ncbi:hypothetical protein GGS20DRAFT_540476 [Poronia punctata]|nr:hypothetical protein GGS20DRAFT_540476 [Poronia punctata]
MKDQTLTTTPPLNPNPDPDPDLDPDPNLLHRLLKEWRVKKQQKDYKPYSEEELDRFAKKWAVVAPIPIPIPTSSSTSILLDDNNKTRMEEEMEMEMEMEMKTLHVALDMLAGQFYDLSWTRRRRSGDDLWLFLWITILLAGATVEDLWENFNSSSSGGNENEEERGKKKEEKMEGFVDNAGKVVLRCGEVLREWSGEKERDCCVKLFEIVREFPISTSWKTRFDWDRRDEEVRRNLGFKFRLRFGLGMLFRKWWRWRWRWLGWICGR